MDLRQKSQKVPARRSLKRKLEQDFEEETPDRKVPIVESDYSDRDLASDIRAHVDTLNSSFSSNESDRAAAKRAAQALSELAKNGTVFGFLGLFASTSANAYIVIYRVYVFVLAHVCIGPIKQRFSHFS